MDALYSYLWQFLDVGGCGVVVLVGFGAVGEHVEETKRVCALEILLCVGIGA